LNLIEKAEFHGTQLLFGLPQRIAADFERKRQPCESAMTPSTLTQISLRGSERIWIYGMTAACAITALMVIGAFFVFGDAPIRSLAQQNIVLLMRHGDAPGREEHAKLALSDCSTQRNLSAQGRVEAREMGAIIRAQAFNVRSVISSRWCRTIETAEMLGLSRVKPEPAFDNLDFNKTRAAELLDAERKIIRAWNGPGVLLVVTHSSNIKALTGMSLVTGAMIIADPDHDGQIQFRQSSAASKESAL
jgi:phosphohistidine phosphatase SixA